MIGYLWHMYGFEFLFGVAVVLLVILFFFNWMTHKKGTYDDHSNFMRHLWTKNYTTTPTLRRRSPRGPFESKGEIECRRVMEKLTGKPFVKVRPDFLRNTVTGGHALELDGYNPELKLAVEYNGEHHYRYKPYFHESKEAFYNLKYRDDMKNRLCKEAGVTLITVPYTIAFSDIEPYLAKQLGR